MSYVINPKQKARQKLLWGKNEESLGPVRYHYFILLSFHLIFQNLLLHVGDTCNPNGSCAKIVPQGNENSYIPWTSLLANRSKQNFEQFLSVINGLLTACHSHTSGQQDTRRWSRVFSLLQRGVSCPPTPHFKSIITFNCLCI